MAEIYGIIYKVTNLVNGKIYIGKTCRTLDKRMKEHIKRAKNGVYNCAFHQAIRKYGEENFNWCIIDDAYSKDDLDDKEKFWIELYRTYRGKNGHGYNMTIGGDGTTGLLITKETRDKMRKSHRGKRQSNETRIKISKALKGKLSGKNHPMYGKKFSDERKRKISESLKGYNHSEETKKKMSKSHKGKKLSKEHVEKLREALSGENNPMYGKKHLDETRHKISQANKGRLSGENNPSAKTIIQLTKDGEFVAEHKTGKDGAKAVNGDLSAIIKCCKGKQKTAYGYKWMYEEDFLALTEE